MFNIRMAVKIELQWRTLPISGHLNLLFYGTKIIYIKMEKCQPFWLFIYIFSAWSFYLSLLYLFRHFPILCLTAIKFEIEFSWKGFNGFTFPIQQYITFLLSCQLLWKIQISSHKIQVLSVPNLFNKKKEINKNHF